MNSGSLSSAPLKDRTPAGWTWTRLDVLARETSERAGDDHTLPVLSVTKHRGIVRADDYFKKVVHGRDTSNYKVVHRGQFAYATIHLDEGSIGLLSDESAGVVSPMYTVFDLVGKIEPRFLLSVLKCPESLGAYRHLAEGTVNRRASVSFRKFGALHLLHPPVPEQRKIAAILSSVDDAIESTQAVIDQLQVVKKAMMAELLSHGLPGRHTLFKKTDIGEIPEGWEVARVADCCVIRNDLRKPINEAEREKIRGPYPYYGPTRAMGSINEYRLDGTFALIGEDGDHFLKFDRWRMTQLVSGQFNVNNHAHVIAGTARCRAEWFATFFQHRDITSRLTRQGANRYKLRKSTLEDLQLPLPSLDEQLTICELLALGDAETASEEAWLEGLRAVKSALLSALLTGEIRVTPDEATP